MPVSVSEIDVCSPLWCGATLNKYHALLVGGSVFNNMKSQFLLRKPSEGPTLTRAMPNTGSPGSQVQIGGSYMPSPGSIDQYSYRMAKTSYKPIIPSLFGYLVAKIFPENPEIDSSDERLINLLVNADGSYRPLVLLCREALINALTYSVGGGPAGSYFQLCQGDDEIKINLMNALSVIDWDGDDQPQWVRTKLISPMRDSEYGPIDKERWEWTIYTGSSVIKYTGVKKTGGSGRPLKIDGPETIEHQLGVCPFIRISLSDYQYLADQIAGPIIEQFNLESDIASLCGKISNAQLIIKTQNKDLGTICIPQMGAIIMDPGDDAKFESPNPDCCKPLFEYRISLRDSIYNSINASVMRASADFIQNPRQSGVAKDMDLEPWRCWSDTFAQPVKSAVSIAIETMCNFYDIEVPEIKWAEPLHISEKGVKESIGYDEEDTNATQESRNSEEISSTMENQ